MPAAARGVAAVALLPCIGRLKGKAAWLFSLHNVSSVRPSSPNLIRRLPALCPLFSSYHRPGTWRSIRARRHTSVSFKAKSVSSCGITRQSIPALSDSLLAVVLHAYMTFTKGRDNRHSSFFLVSKLIICADDGLSASSFFQPQ